MITNALTDKGTIHNICRSPIAYLTMISHLANPTVLTMNYFHYQYDNHKPYKRTAFTDAMANS